MAYPINLSVTGKPSPRTRERIGSASHKKPLSQNKERNQTSNIFWSDNSNKKQQAHGVISKTQLESVRNLTTPHKNKNEQAHLQSPRKPAPKGVPQLHLDAFEDKDEDLSYSKIPPNESTTSPTSKDTVSWGTPLQVKNSSVKGGGWQVHQSRNVKGNRSSHSRHEDVPQLNLQLSNTNEGLQQLRKAAKQVKEERNTVEYFSNQKERNQKKSTDQIVVIQQNRREGEKQQIKKAAFIEDAFLMDQMLNSKITEEKPPSKNFYALANQERFNSKQKRHQDMHSTSASSLGDINENLSRRLAFAARILSLDGRDARRDINGFYFIDESSITMYEYKQFGTKCKALPIIKRGVYEHMTGVRRGRPYNILDIDIGRDIVFRTNEHSILPESLRRKNFIVFRITSVNEEEKESLLEMSCNCSKAERIPTIHKMKSKHEKEDHIDTQNNSILLQVQQRLQKQIKNHGCRFFTNLYHHFNKIDRNKTGFIDASDYKNGLKTFHINLSDEEFDHVISHANKYDDNLFDYGDFIRSCFGCANEQRKYWIRKAFSRLDPAKSGHGNINDLHKFYCPNKDPDVLAGKINSSQALEKIVECFRQTPRKNDISYTEFEAYYEGLSLLYVNDEDFVDVVRGTWTI